MHNTIIILLLTPTSRQLFLQSVKTERDPFSVSKSQTQAFMNISKCTDATLYSIANMLWITGWSQ